MSRLAVAFEQVGMFIAEMRPILPIIFAVLFCTVGAQKGQAQYTFADFAATNESQSKAFAVAFTNGASSQYFFKYSIASSGVISGRGVRYDLAQGSSSAAPTKGKTVTIVSRESRLGNPIRANKDDHSTNLYCPFSLKLSDGAVIKGVMERGLRDYPTYTRMEGTIAYKGAVGSTLSLSNPY